MGSNESSVGDARPALGMGSAQQYVTRLGVGHTLGNATFVTHTDAGLFRGVYIVCAVSAPHQTPALRLVCNGSRLGEVAEHKTSLELQMFKLKIECQTKN